MIVQLKRICFGEVLVACVLILIIFFTYWIVKESDAEQIRYISMNFDRLMLQGNPEEAYALFDKVTEGDEPLDPAWVGLVRAQGSGYVQLEAYVRILAGDPSREASYEEISNLIKLAPASFHKEVKSTYLSDIRTVPGVRIELLNKYELLPN